MEHNKELITIFFFLSKVSKKQCLPYPVVLFEEIYKYIYVCVHITLFPHMQLPFSVHVTKFWSERKSQKERILFPNKTEESPEETPERVI